MSINVLAKISISGYYSEHIFKYTTYLFAVRNVICHLNQRAAR